MWGYSNAKYWTACTSCTNACTSTDTIGVEDYLVKTLGLSILSFIGQIKNAGPQVYYIVKWSLQIFLWWVENFRTIFRKIYGGEIM